METLWNHPTPITLARPNPNFAFAPTFNTHKHHLHRRCASTIKLLNLISAKSSVALWMAGNKSMYACITFYYNKPPHNTEHIHRKICVRVRVFTNIHVQHLYRVTSQTHTHTHVIYRYAHVVVACGAEKQIDSLNRVKYKMKLTTQWQRGAWTDVNIIYDIKCTNLRIAIYRWVCVCVCIYNKMRANEMPFVDICRSTYVFICFVYTHVSYLCIHFIRDFILETFTLVFCWVHSCLRWARTVPCINRLCVCLCECVFRIYRARDEIQMR